MDDILQLTSGNFGSQQLQIISEGLIELNNHALKIKECWEALGNVMEIKSILGLLEEFKYITKILDSELFDNPSMNCGLYRVDQDCLDQLKKAVLSARDDQLNEIKQVIDTLHQCKLIDDQLHAKYLQRWNEIKEKIEGQLENMGFDQAQRQQ